MPMVRAMRLLNAIEAGTTTGAQLETLLTADPGRLADLNVLLGMRGQNERLFASATATKALIASPKALNALVTSVRGSKIMAANPGAMNAVAASSTAMKAVAASSAAKMAVFNSDTALNAIAASGTALTALRAAAGYTVYSSAATTAATISGPVAGGSYIVLGLSTSNAPNGVVNTLSTRRLGSAVVATTTSDGTGFATTALKYPKALPLVAPFTSAQSGASAHGWYFGMLRCDV